jgi:adenine-specific DNA-methyltransferase
MNSHTSSDTSATSSPQVSSDVVSERRKALLDLFPDAFSDGQLSVEWLKRAIGEDYVLATDESYGLAWPGKAEAYKLLQAPTSATLRPQTELSRNFEYASHVFIEGDNLQVLKAMQRSYFGAVSLIYIDPPYNTGSDSFVYPDRFQESREEYLRRINAITDDGFLSRDSAYRRNAKDSGHFHSNWLSMMLPRLYLSRNLLTRSGIICVSCDDNEVHHLRLLLNEVFAEENFIAQVTWEKGRKNDPTFFSESIEYILVYARDREAAAEAGPWRMEKPNSDEVLAYYRSLRDRLGEDHDAIEDAMASFYENLEASNPARYLRHFSRSDRRGLYFPGDISSLSTSIPDYEIAHPVTGRNVKKPERGWGCIEEEMKRRIADDRVEFGDDETTVPKKKNYLEETDKIARTPVLYKDGRGASKVVKALLGGAVFDNPKDHGVLAQLFDYVGLPANDNAIVLDFFAGSCSTAHAVIDLNSRDGGNRRFICVQHPERCDADSAAARRGFKTIADIGRARIDAVIRKLAAERPAEHTRLGFRSFNLAPSVFKVWRGDGLLDEESLREQLSLFRGSEKAGATSWDILWELIVSRGLPLDTPYATQTHGDCPVYSILGGRIVFLLDGCSQATIAALLEARPAEVIAIDRIFNGADDLKSNLAIHCRDAGILFRSK